MVAPAHKVSGDEHKPGQLRGETQLSEYIARKSDDFNYFPLTQDMDRRLSEALSNAPHARQHSKEVTQQLSFQKWYWKKYDGFQGDGHLEEMLACWIAAQEIQNGR